MIHRYALQLVDIAGFLAMSYGLVRESFAALAEPGPYGEGRYGEGRCGGVPSPAVERLVRIGVFLRLLPSDRTLTVTDRRRNAAFAVLGFLLLLVSLVARLLT